jgi:hypothetical protein
MVSFRQFLVALALQSAMVHRSVSYPESAGSRAKEDIEDHDGFEQKILLGEVETKEYHKLSEDEKAARLR